ncbi:MAG: ribosomal-processing cysteine protease Prp [Defluviitaleaceae bacterium]|nr:ribosomal-processing cysteine protease Prp [Defluviitaleaceae bacterium]
MISIAIRRNKKKRVCGFTVSNHADSYACAAISILTINTANSIEALTNEPFVCEHDPEGGFLQLDLPRIERGKNNNEINLLLEAMVLGLNSTKIKYSSEIEIEDDKHD